MEATISSQLNQLITQLKPLESLNDPLWRQPEFVGAAVASIVALLIALTGERLRRLWIKTKLKVSKQVATHIQGGGSLVIYRAVITNKGNHKAQSVEVTVEKIFKEDGSEKENFLPVPLGWTHASAYMGNSVQRDINPEQSVYLNLCEFTHKQRDGQGYKDATLRLAAEAGNEVSDFTRLEKGRFKLILKAYQSDGKSLTIEVGIEWDGENPPIVNIE